MATIIHLTDATNGQFSKAVVFRSSNAGRKASRSASKAARQIGFKVTTKRLAGNAPVFSTLNESGITNHVTLDELNTATPDALKAELQTKVLAALQTYYSGVKPQDVPPFTVGTVTVRMLGIADAIAKV